MMNPDDKPPPYSEVVNTGYASSAPGAPSAPVMTAPGPLGGGFYPPVNHNAGGPHSFGGPQSVALSPARPMHTTNYGSVTLVHGAPEHSVIIVGGCPACRIGVLEDDYSCLGIFCAVFFFPLGILCCLATRQRRCPNCGAIFG